MTSLRNIFRKEHRFDASTPDRNNESHVSKTGSLGDLSGLLLSRVFKDGANPVISPSCLYQMLAMLAGISSNETREQIVSVLGGKEKMRSTLNAITEIKVSNRDCRDFHYSSGASLWLDKSVRVNDNYNQAERLVLIELERVSLGTEKALASMDKWLSDNTGGIFESAPGSKYGDLLVGLTAMHLKDSWDKDFEKEDKMGFTLDDGTRVDVDFMLGWDHYDLLERNGSLTFSKDLSSGCFMVVSIPPKDINLEDYIASGEAWLNMDAYASGEVTEKWRECKVHMPKFSLSSDEVDLADTLKDIGISRIFEPDADFSPLSDDALMVDDIFQSTRLSIDEEGLEGASYAAIVLCGCALPENPPEPREIIVDKPFAVSVFTRSKKPLFVGAVTCPK